MNVGNSSHQPPQTFGERLFWARRQRGMTQQELSEAMWNECSVSIGRNYISQLEGSSSKTPSVQVAAAMAKVLGVSLDYLGMIKDEAELESVPA